MNRLHILSSGSKANAFVLESDGEFLLIDQGLSFREFSKRADILGIDIDRIRNILVTHEHQDHVAGIPYTAHRLDATIFSTEKTISKVMSGSKYELNLHRIDKDHLFSVGCFRCTAFETMHDAIDPVGFKIVMNGGETLCFATDTGKITNRMMSYISDCNHIIIEANHDCSMLYKNRKYSPELKERIRGPKGHLSNDQTLETIDRIEGKCPKTVVFSHLSEENNSPELLLGIVEEFKRKNSMAFNTFIARQNEPFSVLLS